MSDLILEDKLTYKIDSDEPIELNQLILSLKSLGDEYGKFSKIKDVEVKISEVRKGSFEFDFVLMSFAPLLPFMSDVNTTVDFIKRVSELKSFFLNQNSDIKPTLEEAKLMNSINIPIQTFNNYGTVIINDTQKVDKVEFNKEDSKLITTNSSKYIKELKQKEDEEKQNIFKDRLIRFVQTRTDNKDYGNKSICEDISSKEIKTIFENDDIKNEILDNPYHYGFLVDLEVQYINNDAKIYRIMKLNDKINLEENDL
ncbi:hypothetical protein N5T95_00050 [Aliarcobacter cryaerophilus]|jgi:hypothetical protein|uniref:Uncharacterized protein n=1 Tax=Aliarcobacter cryaerophilus TaxID=28198 RepID=A0A2S9SW29_9BACT|nr:hypothetical protein [Aliarcobacter cryaerophilus]MCT7481965.1 hypothetical protein [Aliarcobacter cryaerophilus]MCT7533910.1 hypothetical protein [Aliarcobacter cryaerophilus]PRM90804.1 hypothetical protein CJ671_00250 [Aliarcobacter cryaerophilus]